MKKIIITLLIIILGLPLIGIGYSAQFLARMHDKNLDTTSLNNLDYAHKEGITNILIMGSDARPGEKISRTDSMMILTIDKVHKDIKITSLARDTFVDIPGFGYSKLTHAYAYGKEDLLVKTIEKNFGLDINDFVLINFQSFMSIIDALGGIEANLNWAEIKEMNKFIYECYQWDQNPNKGEIRYVKWPGNQTLTGYQALSFARIRHNDSAFGRDGRQRFIVSSVLKKIKNAPIYKYPSIIKALSPYVKTDMSTGQMLKLGLDIVLIGPSNIKQMEFPIVNPPGYSTGGIFGRHGWVLRFKDSTVDDLKRFIFDDVVFNGN